MGKQVFSSWVLELGTLPANSVGYSWVPPSVPAHEAQWCRPAPAHPSRQPHWLMVATGLWRGPGGSPRSLQGRHPCLCMWCVMCQDRLVHAFSIQPPSRPAHSWGAGTVTQIPQNLTTRPLLPAAPTFALVTCSPVGGRWRAFPSDGDGRAAWGSFRAPPRAAGQGGGPPAHRATRH